jgi:glutathione S-transferase
MLRVLGRKTSINVQKVMWLAEELNLEVERIDIGGPFGGNDKLEYLEKNPNGLVPTLEDGDFTLWESQAICRYITEKYGCLPWAQKSVLDRALAGQWMDWYITKLHPHMTVIFWTLIRTPAEERDMKAVNEAIKQATEAWNIIDSQLKNTEYLLGSSPTLADIPAGCAVNRWYAMDIDRPSLPNLEAWHSRLKDRSAYQNHVIMPLI